MRQIHNMHVVSDDPDLLHVFAFMPCAIGSIETIDGQQYRVIDNSKTTIVTYEPVEE